MIRFDDVVIRYRRAPRDAIGGVSLEALPGAITAVVGPNGSGKSTLVRALIGRIPLGAGRILVDGVPVRALGGVGFAKRVAVVTQREELAFTAATRDYVMLGRYPHLGDWRSARGVDRTAVEQALACAGVAELSDRALDSLSGGEWQRVRLARALAQGARALVLDEPTTFLDVGHEMAVFELLDRLARDGHTVLLVSHQLNLVARFASRMLLLHEGRVAADGAPDDVMRGPILEHVYDWPLVVTRDPAVGAPALLPLRATSPHSSQRPQR